MGQRPLPEDFKDFINFLNANNVRYLLVGGWAVGLYGNFSYIKGRFDKKQESKR